MTSIVKQAFEARGMQYSLGSAHMLPTMEHLCQQYYMQPTALVDHWMVYCDINDMDDAEPVSALEGQKFVRYVHKKQVLYP